MRILFFFLLFHSFSDKSEREKRERKGKKLQGYNKSSKIYDLNKYFVKNLGYFKETRTKTSIDTQWEGKKEREREKML